MICKGQRSQQEAYKVTNRVLHSWVMEAEERVRSRELDTFTEKFLRRGEESDPSSQYFSGKLTSNSIIQLTLSIKSAKYGVDQRWIANFNSQNTLIQPDCTWKPLLQ